MVRTPVVGQLKSDSGSNCSGSDPGTPPAKVARQGCLDSESEDGDIIGPHPAPDLATAPTHSCGRALVVYRPPRFILDAIVAHRSSSNLHQEPANDHIWTRCFELWKSKPTVLAEPESASTESEQVIGVDAIAKVLAGASVPTTEPGFLECRHQSIGELSQAAGGRRQ